MKKFLLLSALLLTGCLFGCREKQTGDLPNINVTGSYKVKTITIQDIADVEYVPLETKKGFLVQGDVYSLGEKYISFRNPNTGDIQLFTRNGKAYSSFNRKGPGPQEYISVTDMFCDDTQEELFVLNGQKNNILVYDPEGEYKRSFPLDSARYSAMGDFGDNIILYSEADQNQEPFTIISKENGSVVSKIGIPYEIKIRKNTTINLPDGRILGLSSIHSDRIPQAPGGCYIMEFSSDTTYFLGYDGIKKPVLTRTPSVTDMDPEVFLFMAKETERYIFASSIKKMKSVEDTDFDATDYVYDKQEKIVYHPDIIDSQIKGRRHQITRESIPNYVSGNIAVNMIPATRVDLIRREGRFSDELMKKLEHVNEEDNPVLVIMKFK
ncbi:MAG: 6-bladed beta-propeller [Alistipes sp.]|nr:6-bladed beta-propeller [Alistipes sp.]